MAPEGNQLAYVSVTGTDRVGLITAMTGLLFDLGGSLADTTFAVLGTAFEFHAVCDLPGEASLDDVAAQLSGLPELEGAEVEVTSFSHAPTHAANAQITHTIDVVGGDRPGLIARLTEAFQDYGANIVRMNSMRLPGRRGDEYVTRFEVHIPAQRADSCLAAIDNTAQQLTCSCQWQEV
jgi:glycine cleavage system transcriptional repressor